MLVFVIVAVFVAGLLVGRTPEYLGHKIESYEMKMASLLILIMPITVLAFTALAVMTPAGKAGILNPGPHGFSEILYAFTSEGNNNGSAFAGLSVNTPFYNITGAVAMLKTSRPESQNLEAKFLRKLLNGSQGNTHHNGGGDDSLGKNHGRGGIEDFKKTERAISP